MPARDYSPVPTVEPRFAPTPKVHEEFPHVQISGAVGQALADIGVGYGTLGRGVAEVGSAFDDLGKNFKHAGDEIFARALALKELASDKKVNDLLIKSSQDLWMMGEQFRTKQGNNANEDALSADLKKGQDYLKAQRDAANLTPEQERKFNNGIRGIYDQVATRNVTHSAQEIHKGYIATNQANISRLTEEAGRAPTMDGYNKKEMELRGTLAEQEHLMGWSREQAEAERDAALSKSRIGWLSNKSKGEPQMAMKILEDEYQGGRILKSDYDKSRAEIEQNLVDQVGRAGANIAKGIIAKNPDATLGEVEKRAEEEARRGTDDPKSIDAAINGARREHSINHAAQIDQKRKDVDVLNEWVAGLVIPGGKKPTTREEVELIPEVKAAWERQKGLQGKYLEALTHNSKEDYVATPANVARFDQLMGMSNNSANYSKFKDPDFMSKIMDEKMPMEFKKQLLARRREIEKEGQNAMDNPKVEKVIGVLKNNGLLSKEFQADSTSMDTFRGKAYKAIMKYEADAGGKVLNDEERLRIGRALLHEIPGSGWFGSDWGKSKVYEKMGIDAVSDIPIEWANQYRSSGTYKDDATMLDDYAKYIFITQFDKFFGGHPVSEGTEAFSGTTPPKPIPGPVVPQSR
jgi:hypothetical protein